jgi:hypothetical protein
MRRKIDKGTKDLMTSRTEVLVGLEWPCWKRDEDQLSCCVRAGIKSRVNGRNKGWPPAGGGVSGEKSIEKTGEAWRGGTSTRVRRR